jgi:hypothetical protein
MVWKEREHVICHLDQVRFSICPMERRHVHNPYIMGLMLFEVPNLFG